MDAKAHLSCKNKVAVQACAKSARRFFIRSQRPLAPAENCLPVKNRDFFYQRRAKLAGGVQPVAKLADNDQISPENVPLVAELWS